jgi:histidyl-tRNA synthetase
VFRRLGIPVTLLLTSLGDPACRPAYREALLAFLRGLGDRLPAAARARAEQNPLRVLDMRDPLVEALTADAPLMRDFLCGACKAHDEAVRELLAGVGLEWVEAPRLVRGLDYYVRTTFEWQAGGLVADLPYADRTLNGHMKAAARAGARTVVILGEQELATGQAAVRDMAARRQEPVGLGEVVARVRGIADRADR